MRTKVLTQADASEIVTLEEAMEHSRITDSYDELVIQGCLDAAHDLVQQWLNRKLTLTTIVGQIIDFRSRITLPFPPIHSVASLTAEDSSHKTVTLTEDVDWKFDSISESIRFLTDCSMYSNFEFNYSAGYTDYKDVPKAIRHAIKMTFATLYENREDVVIGTQVNELPLTAKRLINSHRVLSRT